MQGLVFPFDDSDKVDQEAAHLFIRDDFDKPPSAATGHELAGVIDDNKECL